MSRSGRTAIVLVVALAALAGAAGCGGAAAAEVAAADFRFEPSRVEVEPGTAVKWTNRGQTAHNVKGPGFGTKRVLDPGQSYSHRFTKAGTYPYVCTLHPAQMKATVVVG